MRALGVMGLLVGVVPAPGCVDAELAAIVRAEVDPVPVRELVDEQEERLRRSACSDADNVANAAEEYLRFHDKCPSTIDALGDGWLLMNVARYHPHWSFECTETDVIVREPGLDARFGTEDDVVYGGPHPTCER